MSKVSNIGFRLPDTPAADISHEAQLTYWHGLIGEAEAAEFLGLAVRTLQGLRQRGGSPRFVRVSSRAVRYRRCDLAAWADARLKSSTWEA